MPEQKRRVMLQIEWPHPAKLTLRDAKELLGPTGIELDETYGPILVNPQARRFLVRGMATAEATDKARAIAGVGVFADTPIKPMR